MAVSNGCLRIPEVLEHRDAEDNVEAGRLELFERARQDTLDCGDGPLLLEVRRKRRVDEAPCFSSGSTARTKAALNPQPKSPSFLPDSDLACRRI